MNFRRRILLFVFQTNSVLIGYSRRMESNKRHVCSSLQTNGRWLLGSQNVPATFLIKELDFLLSWEREKLSPGLF